jgi:uncharacterized protein (TIGR03118 family)
MHTSTPPRRVLLALAAFSLTLAACGGGGYGGGDYMPAANPGPVVMPVATTVFSTTRLVGDVAGAAANTDKNLVNAWGIAFNPTGFVWVANNGSNTSTLYDGNGVPQTLVVATPDEPTGIVFNGSSTDFKITQNGATGASAFIFSTESGAIAAWSPGVDRNNAIKVVDSAAAGSVYKGLAIASYNGASYIYAADFHNRRIDVFDTTFAKVALPGSFQDSGLPTGYAPFGIQAIGDRIYVTYAQRQAAGEDEAHGAGLGVVDVYDTAGNLIKQLVMGGALNAPWGIAMAPSNFGDYSGKLLVANFGDGTIHAYDAATGAAAGVLSKTDGSAIVIDGLWGIAFGPGVNSQPTNTLFYTAGPGDETHGAYGRIDLAP